MRANEERKSAVMRAQRVSDARSREAQRVVEQKKQEAEAEVARLEEEERQRELVSRAKPLAAPFPCLIQVHRRNRESRKLSHERQPWQKLGSQR